MARAIRLVALQATECGPGWMRRESWLSEWFPHVGYFGRCEVSVKSLCGSDCRHSPVLCFDMEDVMAQAAHDQAAESVVVHTLSERPCLTMVSSRDTMWGLRSSRP